MSIPLKIAGANRTANLLAGSVRISSQLNSRDTCQMTLVSTDGSYRPSEGQPVELGIKSTATFARSSVAYKSDGSQVAIDAPRYETGKYGQAVMVEEGTTNLLKNASFEVYTGTTGVADGWNNIITTASITTSFAVDNTIYRSGSTRSQKIAITNATGYGEAKVIQSAAANAGITYTFSVYCQGSLTGSARAFIRIEPFNSSGVLLSGGQSNVFVPTGGFVQYSISITAPTDTATIQAQACIYATASGDTITVYYDDAQLEAKPYPTSIIFANDTTTQPSRSAETLTIPTAGVLSATAGTIEFTIIPQVGPVVPSGDAAYNDFTWGIPGRSGFLLRRYWDGASWFLHAEYYSTTGTVRLNYAYTWAVGEKISVAFRWSSAGCAWFVNGVLRASDTRIFVAPVETSAQIGYRFNYRQGNALYDDLRISNISRSDADILAGVNSGAPLAMDGNTTLKLAFDNALIDDNRIFAGSISRISESQHVGTSGLWYEIECADYNELCDRHFVARAYDNQTLGQIVTDIVTQDLAGEGISTAGVETGPTITRAVFNYSTVTAAFNDLSDLTGLSWYIDYNKTLYFRSRNSNLAPFGLTATSKNWRNLRVERTREQYRNRQYLRAGQDLTSTRTENFAGDGKRRTFTLSYPVGKVPTITVNGVAKTVGIRTVDSGKDFYWNKGSPDIVQDDAGTLLTSTDTLAVTYQGLFPIIVASENAAEISARAALMGGTGVYESVDEAAEIDSNSLAIDYANGLLRRFGVIPTVVTFETDTAGLAAGQLININIPVHGLSGDFLIESVETNDINARLLRYQVKALSGERLGGWDEFFRKLSDTGGSLVLRENEVLLMLRTFGESMVLSDAMTTTAVAPETRVGYALVGFSEVA